MRADGRTALLTRSADLRQARHTSNLTDIRIWKDAAGADPTRDLRAMLDDLGAGRRLGVEFDSYGLTHFNGRRLEVSLPGDLAFGAPPGAGGAAKKPPRKRGAGGGANR